MLDIRVEGQTATARKTFNDKISLEDGGFQALNWQSVFFCTKEEGAWKISGFVGFLPFAPG
ncbi:nuclear transport factor 2 family protein [Rhizobium bangladeshense]|uniref:nuclear transport factor 2 family protein n=2 Tax=Rhizobium TaxID=379 RepID=UPI000B2FB122|nr:nuclear transport factor 2 family protein [Rhizobium bangladeshense]